MRPDTVRRRVASARALRREQTPAEAALWQMLRHDVLGHRFRRQHGIGPFVVDFCCLPARLVVEVDGGVHDRPDVAEQDAWRTEYLGQHGFRVLRVSNDDVLCRSDEVLSTITAALAVPIPPSPITSADPRLPSLPVAPASAETALPSLGPVADEHRRAV